MCADFCALVTKYKGAIGIKNFDKRKYDNEYAKHNYDRCIFNVPKGQKAVIEEHWRAKGYKSLNSYVNELIRADMAKENTQGKTVNIGRDNKGTINM